MAYNTVAATLLGLTFLSATAASGAVITVTTDRDDGRQVINVDRELTTADHDDFSKLRPGFIQPSFPSSLTAETW
jgi:hypothetical protein